jgi:preprotein translocase subunit SecG
MVAIIGTANDAEYQTMVESICRNNGWSVINYEYIANLNMLHVEVLTRRGHYNMRINRGVGNNAAMTDHGNVFQRTNNGAAGGGAMNLNQFYIITMERHGEVRYLDEFIQFKNRNPAALNVDNLVINGVTYYGGHSCNQNVNERMKNETALGILAYLLIPYIAIMRLLFKERGRINYKKQLTGVRPLIAQNRPSLSRTNLFAALGYQCHANGGDNVLLMDAGEVNGLCNQLLEVKAYHENMDKKQQMLQLVVNRLINRGYLDIEMQGEMKRIIDNKVIENGINVPVMTITWTLIIMLIVSTIVMGIKIGKDIHVSINEAQQYHPGDYTPENKTYTNNYNYYINGTDPATLAASLAEKLNLTDPVVIEYIKESIAETEKYGIANTINLQTMTSTLNVTKQAIEDINNAMSYKVDEINKVFNSMSDSALINKKELIALIFVTIVFTMTAIILLILNNRNNAAIMDIESGKEKVKEKKEIKKKD